MTSSREHFKLNPITSANTSRYDNPGGIQLCAQAIAKGPPSRRRFPASKWVRHVHPEGQPYSTFNGESGFLVVTEANVDDIQIEARILAYVKVASKELQKNNIEVPPRCELFLEPSQDHMSCNYYFVDHTEKQLFWIENLDTESLGIPAALSSSHLEKELERLYWMHVEFFPMHHKFHEQEFCQFLDDIYNIVSHGYADRLTSNTSTFPYPVDVCKEFLKLLSRKQRGQRLDGYTLCFAARLARTISNQRFLTLYGQYPAQLDRLQEMCPADPVEHRWLSIVTNLLMWGIPQHYTSLLEDLYLNEQVYLDQWTQFVTLCLADWTNSLSWSFPTLIASILLANVRGGTVSMSMPSVLSCAVSIASASCLHLRHQPLVGSSATAGVRYLISTKSCTVGFLFLSVAFSLPRASYLWGMGFLTAQFILVAFHCVNKLIALTVALVISALLLFMHCAIDPKEASIALLYRSLVSLYNPRLYDVEAHENGSMA